MNVELQIHGVLSSGQARWKQEDKDYYTQFYSGQTENTLMIVEIVNRPHGISTYYNYLLNNNILSSREGSYFGMTVRIDGAFCKDVKSIYMILDNLYNKMIVGNVLVSKNNGKYEYAIDSFSTHSDYLAKVETQFSNMFNAFFSPQDFFEISANNTSQGSKLSINASEISIPTAVEAVKQRAKLYLSPEYQSKLAQQKIDEANARAKAAQEDANARIEAAEQIHNKSRLQRESEFENWKKEKKSLEDARDKAVNDYRELEKKVKTADLNKSISDKIAEIKVPISQLAGLMASRFPEKDKGNLKEDTKNAKINSKNHLREVWLPWIICGVLAVILAVVLWNMASSKPSDNSGVIEQQNNQIEQLKDSIQKMTNPTGASTPSDDSVLSNSNPEDLSIANYDLSKLRIDIEELSGGNLLERGKTYHFTMQGGNYPPNGYWVVCEGDNVDNTNKNELTVTAPSGTLVTITYYLGTSVIKDRKLRVK